MAKKKIKKEEEIEDIEELDEELDEDSQEGPKSIFSNPKVIYGFVVFAILAFAAWQVKGFFVAAIVNNSPISRVAFVKELEERYGEEILDSMITQKIIEQSADEQGIVVSDVEINEQIESIRSSIELQGTTLEDALALQGQTEENLRRGIKLSIMVEKIFEDQIQISDEDIRTFYEQNKQLYGEEATFEELSGGLRDQMVQQQLAGMFQTWLDNKKSEAVIHQFVNFN